MRLFCFVRFLSFASYFLDYVALAFPLTPTTTPESIVQLQLQALQEDDMYSVFKFASPNNKAMTGPWQRFGAMVRSPPYHHLVGHREADVLLGVTSGDNWRGLVRVLSKSSELPVEYWWALSRCTEGPFPGCYMVDAVLEDSSLRNI
jgi:hypothetical protein